MSNLFHRIRTGAAKFTNSVIKKADPLFTKIREGVSVGLRKAANTARDITGALDSDVAKSIAAATGTEQLREGVHAGIGDLGELASRARGQLEANVPHHLTHPTGKLINFQ